MKKIRRIIRISCFSARTVASGAPLQFSMYLVLTLMNSFLPTVVLIFNRRLFNEAQILIEEPTAGSLSAVMVFAGLYVMAERLHYGMMSRLIDYSKQYVGDVYHAKMNARIHAKLSRIRYDYYLKEESYDLISRVKGDCAGAIFNTVFEAINVIGLFLTLMSSFLYMMSIGAVYAVAGLLVSLPYIFIQNRYNFDNYYRARGQAPEVRKANYMQSLLTRRSALKEIRLDRSDDFLLDRWQEHQNSLFRASHKLQRKLLYKLTYYDIFYEFVRCAILFWNAGAVLDGAIMVGELTAVQNGFDTLSQKTQMLGNTVSGFAVNEKLFDEWNAFFAYEEETSVSAKRVKDLRRKFLESGLHMWNIVYRYPNSPEDILSSLDFHIEPGEKVALVGENGCGKTTMVRALLGLLAPSGGDFTCGGSCASVEIRKISTCVFQNHVNYSGTIRDNITLCEEGYNEPRLREVCEKLGILAFIDALPNGFDTKVGDIFEDSTHLSGGQWQKLALARALYKENAELIILDEPTSALDPKTEFSIYDEFLQLTKNKSVILISHRLAFTQLMDRVCYMEHGKIIEEGTHKELMKLGGKYYELYNKQVELFR